MRLKTSAAPLALLLAACAAPAFAQTEPTAQTTPSWIGDVVITGLRQRYASTDTTSATRTDTPLIQVPQSVQVLTSSLLEEQGVRHLSDALVNVSGVTATQPQEVLLTPPLLRGFPGEVYVDGLPIFGGNQQAFDPAGLVGIERIEVLKGPSSALYGGGLGSPLGGLINIVSERPADTFGGYFGVRAGSFSTWNPYGSVNLPLAEGVAARISAEYQSSESWIDQVEGERWVIKPSLSVQLGPDTELLFQAQINRNSQLEYSGLPAEQALAGELERNAFPGAPVGQPHTRMENHLETVTLRHVFSDKLKLTVTGRYYDSEVVEVGSFVFPAMYAPDPATPTVYPILPMNMFTTTQEGALDANLQIAANAFGGDHRILVGVSYDHTKFYSGMAFTGVPVGEIDLANPTYTLPFGPLEPMSMTQTDRYQTSAIYVQDQVTYGRLHLTGSLRLTRLNFKEAEQGTDETYNHLSPRIGATFDVAPGIALYAGYATAFRAPFGFIGLETPEPETSENVEGGVKLAMTRLGLSGTIAIFEQTRDNVATPDPDNPLFSIQTGTQRARGLEADFIWEPTPAFSLLANYAYTDAEVTRDNSLPVGDTLPRIPKNSGRIAGRYRVLDGAAAGLSFGAGVTSFGARQDTLPNSVWVPGYTTVDAQAAYDFGRVTVELSAVNLTDSDAFDTYQYFGFPVVIPTQPRSAFVTLKTRF
ncbi:TonB-dependent siderophore receptor [Brevundimonas sp. SL130]|uniref:TonB-dependent siderophore receptor n=1 Tax=Brevundimonas sp. SL130 TaxID=2995143 RepID=UPI00226D2359|nr:TonB-dependent siderophore receptor [Brevundimonas sp. SL130]WAC60925.1 TonB-dependent siderophore receptor [Brevundimonas sp. SL130]